MKVKVLLKLPDQAVSHAQGLAEVVGIAEEEQVL